MTLEECFSWMESFTNLEKKPDPTLRAYRLDRMYRLCGAFGHPEKSFKALHVAGSKGKGTTAAFLAAGLGALGFKTGLYASPHLLDWTERITLGGKPFEPELYIAETQALKNWVDQGGGNLLEKEYGQGPTTFELLTLLAFLVFRKSGVQWAVLEVGLGGRLDATNIILPEASILTPIELEHTDILGTTLQAIAGEKAGIIKPQVPVFCAPQPKHAYEIFTAKAEELGCRFYYLPEELDDFSSSPAGQGSLVRWKFQGRPSLEMKLSMAGAVMGWNALLALEVLNNLFPGKERLLLPGLSETKIPGRMQFLGSKMVLDGAHTRRSCQELILTLDLHISSPRTLVFGAVEGKDWEGMAEVLAPGFSEIFITTPGTFKKSDPQGLFQVFARHHGKVRLEPDPLKARILAEETGNPVVVCGSFYLVAEFLRMPPRQGC